MNLFEILKSVDDIAEQGIELPAELDHDLKSKIDAYYNALDFLKSESARTSVEVERLQKRVKSLDNSIERLKDYMINSMKAFGWEKIKGLNHNATLVRQKRFKIFSKPEERLDSQYIVEETFVKHYWDQVRLKAMVEADPESVAEICGIVDSEYLRLS